MFATGVPMANIKMVAEDVTQLEIYVPLQNALDEGQNVIISAIVFTVDDTGEATSTVGVYSNAQKQWKWPAL